MRSFFTLLLAITLTACKSNPPKIWTVHSYNSPARTETIHFEDPAGDLKDSLAFGDQRFIGVMGYALNLPGVPSADQSYIRHTYGAKVVDGISDVENETSARIGYAARDYAQKYNAALLLELERLKRASPPPQ